MVAALGFGLLGMVWWQASAAPDISGKWQGEEWGAVVLDSKQPGTYQGTYSDTVGKEQGTLELKWSRVERRFNGTWREGEDRFGEISVRLFGDEIRGAHTTDPKSKINPGTPRLADLAWTRAKSTSGTGRSELGAISRRVPFEVGATYLRDGDQITIDEVNGTADTMKSGNMYEIKGTYRLASRGKATLAAYVTDDSTAPKAERRPAVPTQKTQSQTVERGAGKFSLVLYVPHDGQPHVSFYPESGGEGFGHVYFGTGDLVLKKGWWEASSNRETQPQPKNQGGAKQKLIDGLLTRCTAITSGRIDYHLKTEIAGRTIRESEYHFTFSGESWAMRYPRSENAAVNHNGRLLRYWTTPQKDGRVSRSLTVELPETAFKHEPNPPVLAGTLWNSSTNRFVRDRASEARLLGAETVNGVETQVLEWDVSATEAYEAFHAITDLLKGGGKLRLHVAPQLGYALPRIEHVDKFGTVQALFESSDFKEAASKVYFPMKCVCTIGTYVNAYDVKLMEKCNEPISDEDFVISIPAGTSVADTRPKLKDKVGPDRKRTTSHEDYPFRVFNTGAAYPKGFPADLLKELDRDVVSVEVAVKEQTKAEKPQNGAAPKPVLQFPTGDNIKAIAYSTDGKFIAIANDQSTFPANSDWKRAAKILDAQTGKIVVSLQVTTQDEYFKLAATKGVLKSEVEAVALSPDGSLVAVGTSIGQVKLFDTHTGELVRSLDDEPAKLADTKSPEKLKPLARALGSVASLMFSPDGRWLATCGGSFDDVPLVPEPVDPESSALRLSRLVSGPGRLKVWDVKTGALQNDLTAHSQVHAVAFSADGNLLASAGRWTEPEPGTGVIIWNSQTGKRTHTITLEATGVVHAIAFSPDSKHVAIGSRDVDQDGAENHTTGIVRLTQVESGSVEWRVAVRDLPKTVAFLSDGKSVAVLIVGRSIRILDSTSGKLQHEIRAFDSPSLSRWNDFAVSRHGSSLAIGGVGRARKGIVELWDVGGHSTAAKSAPAKDSADQVGNDDAKLLDGTWKVIALEFGGQKAPPGVTQGWLWSFNNLEQQSANPSGKPEGKSTVKVDSSKTPMHIDLVKAEGPRKGQVRQGIFKFENNTLVICLRSLGAAEKARPMEFVTEADSGLTMITLERIKQETPAVGDPAGNWDDRDAATMRFSETKEVVLSMGSLKFMLDLDTGKTMDPPATAGRPEEKLMDVLTDQEQPYHYPKELIGRGLHGMKVKANEWDASAAEVCRALASDQVEPLKQMDVGPEQNPTYFFKTRDGTMGVLQLLGLVEEPKGIRIRYKTVEREPGKSPAKTTAASLKSKQQFPISDGVQAIACSFDGKRVALARGKVFHPLASERKHSLVVLDADLVEGYTAALLQITSLRFP